MKSQEFLDILGNVDEKYVLAADENVVCPKFRWQPWAAAAACVALICVATYPRFASGFSNSGGGSADCAPSIGDEPADAMEDSAVEEPAVQESAGTLIQTPGLHSYFLFEEARTFMTTAGEAKAPAGGVDDAALEKGPVPEPAPAPNAEGPVSGAFKDAPADVPYDPENGTVFPYVEEAAIDQDEATRQYQNLLQNAGLGYAGEGYYPEWFGGAWIDNDWPDNTGRLTIAMVAGWDTETMENMVRGWCGGTGDVLFCTVKYSYARLNGLMDEISAVFDQYGWLPSAYGSNEEANRIELDIFGMPGDELLADLARLDPDGDAIRVQVFTDRTIRFTDDAAMKPPAPAEEPALSTPAVEPEPTPITEPDGWEDVPADPGSEEGQTAQYDVLSGGICRLPLAKPGGE